MKDFRKKLIDGGYIESNHLSYFRHCFEGKEIRKQIVWLKEDNRLYYFIRQLTDPLNNYVEIIDKSWSQFKSQHIKK